MDRLQKVIAQAGITSRRKAEELIVQGKVKVNGEIITQLGYCPPKGASIEVDGQKIQREDKVYYVLYKPKKTICAVKDDRDRKTVCDLFDVKERIYPVGRLDYDTTGVLIMTNDGEFANEIIHPRYHLARTYEVSIDGILEPIMIKELEKGIMLEDGMTLPVKIRVTRKDFEKQTTSFEMTLKEGRNRQIKRMMEHYGFRVTRLHRRNIEFLYIRDLKPGEYRRLKPFEVAKLRELSMKGNIMKK